LSRRAVLRGTGRVDAAFAAPVRVDAAFAALVRVRAAFAAPVRVHAALRGATPGAGALLRFGLGPARVAGGSCQAMGPAVDFAFGKARRPAAPLPATRPKGRCSSGRRRVLPRARLPGPGLVAACRRPRSRSPLPGSWPLARDALVAACRGPGCRSAWLLATRWVLTTEGALDGAPSAYRLAGLVLAEAFLWPGGRAPAPNASGVSVWIPLQRAQHQPSSGRTPPGSQKNCR